MKITIVFNGILAEQNTFKASVLATRDERHLTSMEMKAPLQEGDEIKFFCTLAGG
jgi:hypothetical protein